MSGMFTSVFNPGLSVSDGSGQGGSASTEESYASGESGGPATASSGATESGNSSQGAAADADIDLGLEVTLSNDVAMTWTDDQGNVQSYSQSDELTLDVDVQNTLDGLLANEAGYTDAATYEG